METDLAAVRIADLMQGTSALQLLVLDPHAVCVGMVCLNKERSATIKIALDAPKTAKSIQDFHASKLPLRSVSKEIPSVGMASARWDKVAMTAIENQEMDVVGIA